MHYRGRCACEPPRALGALPVATVAVGFVTKNINTVLSKLGLSSSDPTKDQERINRINQNFEAAMTGDTSAVACLRDMAQGVSSGPNDPRQCAVGSQVAAAYAKAAWLEYEARRGAGQVGAVLVGESPQFATAVSWLPWAAVGAAAFLFLRRR